MDARWSWFETFWKPKKWDTRFRFLLIRQRVHQIFRGPIQLDLFVPHEEGFDFKVIVTNKTTKAKKVLMFHHGRAEQEGLFGELKSQSQMDYIPVRRLNGNQFYSLAAILAHNLTREIQMVARLQDRGTTEKRSALWSFDELKTLRYLIIQRAGRLTNSQGKLTLTMCANAAVQKDFLFSWRPSRKPPNPPYPQKAIFLCNIRVNNRFSGSHFSSLRLCRRYCDLAQRVARTPRTFGYPTS